VNIKITIIDTFEMEMRGAVYNDPIRINKGSQKKFDNKIGGKSNKIRSRMYLKI